VKGSLRYGTIIEDTTFTFNVNYTLAKSGGQLAAGNGEFKVLIPKGALKEDTYLIAGRDVASPGSTDFISALAHPELPVYTVSPLGKKMKQPISVTIDIPEIYQGLARDSLVVGYWDGKNWRELPTEVDFLPNTLLGYSLNLGRFTILKRGNGVPMESISDLLPTEYALAQNYPNPFNPETLIQYDLPTSGVVRLVVYDILGREVVTLQRGYMPAGHHQVVWNGRNAQGKQVVSGLYFYQLNVNGFRNTKKMILAR
jgi:hypothetical protein